MLKAYIQYSKFLKYKLNRRDTVVTVHKSKTSFHTRPVQPSTTIQIVPHTCLLVTIAAPNICHSPTS